MNIVFHSIYEYSTEVNPMIVSSFQGEGKVEANPPPMRFITSKTWTLVAGLALVCTVVPLSITSANGAPTSALSTPSPESGVKVRGGADEATPAPVTYTTIDGIWEVQLQPGSLTQYSHFFLVTSGDAISGTWKHDRQQKHDKEYSMDVTGRLINDRFSMNGSDAKGPYALNGYIENSATMIGEFTQGHVTIPFTASHQGLPLNERPPKQKHSAHHKHRHGEAAAPSDETPTAAP